MSKYTTELRYICEEAAGLKESEGFSSIDAILNAARPKIFSFDYPIFDRDYKPVLETKILKHFYTREIGAETVGLWKLWLEAAMTEIMPYYNTLYHDGLQVINPFYTTDITEAYDAEGTKTDRSTVDKTESGSHSSQESGSHSSQESGSTTNGGTITDSRISSTLSNTDESGSVTDSGSDTATRDDDSQLTRWDKFSDTPQGAITNLDEDKYLTDARKITEDHTGSMVTDTTEYGKMSETERSTETIAETEDDNTRTLNTSQTDSSSASGSESSSASGSESRTGRDETQSEAGTTDHYVRHRYGRDGLNVAQILDETRDLIMDIDRMIIRDLEPLFMHLW